MAKRRFFVAFEDSEVDSNSNGPKKIVVTVDSTATNHDLGKEIAQSVKREYDGFILELPGGFELRPEDRVQDTIREDELVTLREIRSIRNPIVGTSNIVKTTPQTRASFLQQYLADPTEPCRLQIRLISAELARRHASALKSSNINASTDVDGVLAFEGEFVSGNTSLHALRREVVRVFGWMPDDDTTVDDDDDDSQCDHRHKKGIACSCAVALEIEQHGLLSMLHCRFVLDGEQCLNSDCPYSHSKLNYANIGHSTTPPHCIICDEFLGFPCPKCIPYATDNFLPPSAVLHCPLVQNAGCGHLHHAHCFRMNKNALPGCPTGCPREKFPREASIFDLSTPHIILVWDGNKIDRIPVTARQDGGTLISLSSQEVIGLVREFLISKQFALPGLCLRIHLRNPITETIRFTQSTLVSVCHASTHTQQAHHRFPIFADEDAPTTHFLPLLKRKFHVDLHTSEYPVLACRCTRLRDIFCTEGDARGSRSIVLYAVKRQVESGETASKFSTVSKEKTFLLDQAWQPSVPQTTRGMAAFLSCLYRLSHLIPPKGPGVEASVLSIMHQITCFPPAVRALGMLFLNRDVRPEERAALSEAMYHALTAFLSCSHKDPAAIISSPGRFFEASRILLAHILETAKKVELPKEHTAIRPIEELHLVCATSGKLLNDPVTMDSQVVNRASASLYQRGGELYRPASMPIIAEMTDKELEGLKRAVTVCGTLTITDPKIQSIIAFDVEKLLAVPPSPTIAQTGRDLIGAIEAANKSSLVTRGPLDLKSVNVVPPQLVLDQEGFIAVFTGRGCGMARDVNFFRPTSGGDTEVDVNDVSYALEKVIEQRRLEDTWQIDTFGSVSAAPIRPPDEAIVLCLDLSESMNHRSGVSHRNAGMALDEDRFDPLQASFDLLDDLAKDVSDEDILQHAKDYLINQHSTCHWAWKFHIDHYGRRRFDNSESDEEDSYSFVLSTPVHDLLQELGVLARRAALNLSLTLETNTGNSIMRSKMIEAAHFSIACDSQTTALANYLSELLDRLSDDADVGVEPYTVPRRLIDPRTGDLLLDPVVPENAPDDSTFVNAESSEWFEDQVVWPIGCFESNLYSVSEVERAVAEWISGQDILPVKDKDYSPKGKGSETWEDIEVTLFYEGSAIVWDLSIHTSTRTLYCLANRATKARYSRFTLRMVNSKATITDSASLTLGLTDLSDGGVIEICFTFPHKRRPTEVTVKSGVATQVFFLPQDAPILALMSYLDPDEFGLITDIRLWHCLRLAGDGVRKGSIVKSGHNLRYYGVLACEFEVLGWKWDLPGTHQERKKSRYLSRLDVLKELFNVFINRACSFDTSVSLVLGLVTFSDKAIVKHELTPIFESFRQELEKVSASGDTAVYDALDVARKMLVNYRSDLPHLRKRIIIVTDGADTSSKASARDVCLSLQRSSIIVDSVQVGPHSDRRLHAISVATGGYRFCPQTSLSDALSIFDLETILSSAERTPRPPRPLVFHEIALSEYGDTTRFPVDVVTISQFPSRAAHMKLQEIVKPAARLTTSYPIHDDRTKRIMRELKALVADPHPQMDVYVNDSDISFLKIILEAPKDDTKCPYQNGTFLLTCDIPETYPRDPPEIRFVTFILHPNVSKQGKICVAELGRLWSSDITLKEIFSLIYGLLLEPDLENPVEIQASLKYYDDDGTFALAVAESVVQHASKSREQWRLELADD